MNSFVLGVEYQAFGSSKSHAEAQKECRGFNQQNLSSFVSPANIDKIIESFKDLNVRWYWTGLKYKNSSCNWSFIDGADTRFAVSRVSVVLKNVHYDKCVAINGTKQFSAIDCDEKRSYVCQKGQHPTGPPMSTLTG